MIWEKLSYNGFTSTMYHDDGLFRGFVEDDRCQMYYESKDRREAIQWFTELVDQRRSMYDALGQKVVQHLTPMHEGKNLYYDLYETIIQVDEGLFHGVVTRPPEERQPTPPPTWTAADPDGVFIAFLHAVDGLDGQSQ